MTRSQRTMEKVKSLLNTLRIPLPATSKTAGTNSKYLLDGNETPEEAEFVQRRVEEGPPIYVNFVSATKVGFGPIHQKLMRTEYASYLEGLNIPDKLPFYDFKGQVITAVFKPSHKVSADFLSITAAFEGLKEFCKTKNIGYLYISFQPWIRERVDLELIRMLSFKTFKDSGILVVMG